MKRTVEIDDTLQERVDDAIADVKQELLDYLEQNPDTDKLPDLGYSGAIHEIVDSHVPIYTKEIDDTWYLYAYELEEAYENAGVGNNPRENNGMAAIYYYIDEKVREWYDGTAQDIFDEWKEAPPEDEDESGTMDEQERITTGAECESCAESGTHGVPATTKSVNPDWSGYNLCRECAREYDSRPPINATQN